VDKDNINDLNTFDYKRNIQANNEKIHSLIVVYNEMPFVILKNTFRMFEKHPKSCFFYFIFSL